MLGLYVHIPFCQAICGYCNFNRGLRDAALEARYVEALVREIRSPGLSPVPSAGRQADTIFFGGGTPSVLDPVSVGRVIGACREQFLLAAGAEITLETNPETATAGRLEAFLDAGVTRISFGVQSFDDEELARLGRIHSAARAAEAILAARAAGVRDISLDLMFWLPGQSRASWRATVERAIDLGPDHLSLYLLELYPNAPLKESMARETMARVGPASAAWTQAPDDEAADMYLEALDVLDAAGYTQYEISNVARPGHESRHNVKYWQGGEWHGFGCGAHSTVGGVRWRNVASTADYVERIGAERPVHIDRQALSEADQRAEALFLGLRMTAGVDEGNLRRRHGVEPWLQYREVLAPLVEEGLMWRRDGHLGLTRRGMLVATEILATFV